MRSPRRWQIERRERLFEHPILSLERHSLSSPSDPLDDSKKDRRQALVLDTPDWINIVALRRETESSRDLRQGDLEHRDLEHRHLIDDSPSVVMVRQWRFGIESPTLEIPGGIVDPGESTSEAAARELLEETGYLAKRWKRLGHVEPNPALFNNRCVTYLAEDLEHEGQPAGDGDEEIEVTTVPLSEIPALISSGEIGHALVIAAFHFLHLDASS